MAKKPPKSQALNTTRFQKTNSRSKSKKEMCIALLKRSKGASLADLQRATGWQAHSVRGFLSGTVKNLAGVTLVSEQTKGGKRRYSIQAMKAP